MRPFHHVMVPLAWDSSDEGLLEYAHVLGDGLMVSHVHVGAERPQFLKCHGGFTRANIPGERTDVLLEFASTHEVDLILLGHRSKPRSRRSLARRLAMTAPCSVWMAPQGSQPRLERIVAPIDFSERAADALSLATALAASSGVEEILGVHVHFNSAATTFDGYAEQVEDELHQRFRIFVARIETHGVQVIPRFVESPHVAPAVLRVAEETHADLIVMGTRGRSRSAAALLGSETEHVLIESRIPVLAVKHFGSQLPLLRALLEKRVRGRGDLRFT